jgi:hypothetical protein
MCTSCITQIMGKRVTASLEELHLEVVEAAKREHGVGSDAAGVRAALEEVATLREELEEAQEEISLLEQRVEQRDQEFRLMSVVVPMALGMDREAVVEMLPGLEAEDLPEVPETYQPIRQVQLKGPEHQPGALKRAKRWLVGSVE